MAERITIAMFIALALVVAAGCGDGEAHGNGAVANTQAIIGLVSTGSVVTRDRATCIADRATPKLSSAGITLAQTDNNQLSDLSNADRTTIYQAFDACVTTAQIADAVAADVPTKRGQKLDARAERCFTVKLVKQYRTSGDLMKDDWSGDSPAVESIADRCMST